MHRFTNRLSKYPLFPIILAVSVVFSVFSKIYPYFTFDVYVSKNIQSFYSPFFDIFLRLLTFLGLPLQGFVMTIVILGYLIYRKKIKEAFFTGLSTSGAVALSAIVKSLVQRPRPAPDLIISSNQFTKADSYPSGHVLFFVGLFGFLFYLTLKLQHNKKLKQKLLFIFGFAIFFIGVSRIYLGAHWFSDVIGAYLLGYLWLNLIIKIYKKTK